MTPDQVINETLQGLEDPVVFAERLRGILVSGAWSGDKLSLSLHLPHSSPAEIQKTKRRCREILVELATLRSEIVAEVQKVNAKFSRCQALLAGLPPANKAKVRELQLEFRENHNSVKMAIDKAASQLKSWVDEN